MIGGCIAALSDQTSEKIPASSRDFYFIEKIVGVLAQKNR